MKKLFGTDGIRGVANVYPLSIDICLKLARAIQIKFLHSKKKSKIILGKDTRISGDIFEHAFAAAFCSLGVDIILVGVIPTPAMSVLVKKWGADFGIIISASHNPFYDNGIKLFNDQGLKLNDEEESELEELMFSDDQSVPNITHEKIERATYSSQGIQDYIDEIFSSFNFDKEITKNIKIAIDSSNGAMSEIADKIFKKFGFNVVSRFNNPNGININDHCGVTYPDTLSRLVTENNCDLGIAFDGDGDRVLLCDENGKLLNGDDVLAILSLEYKNSDIVSTIMSNLGFEQYLSEKNIKLIRTNVGDKYISEYLQTHDAEIGGEPSGHIIIKSHSLTGDGLFSGLAAINVFLKQNCKMSEMKFFEPLPVISKNVRVSDKSRIKDPKVIECIERWKNELQNRGRLIVRQSGTEPMIRVTAEGRDIQELTSIVNDIEKVIVS